MSSATAWTVVVPGLPRHPGHAVAGHHLDSAHSARLQLGPGSCYLGFEIDLRSTASHATLKEVFDFVRDDCEVQISAVDEAPERTAAIARDLVTRAEPSLYAGRIAASGAQ